MIFLKKRKKMQKFFLVLIIFKDNEVIHLKISIRLTSLRFFYLDY